VKPYYYAAFNCIDWTIPGEKIGDRKKPLAAKTIERIKAGLERYSGQGFILDLTYKNGIRVKGLTENVSTQTTFQDKSIVMPFLIKHEHSRHLNLKSANEPGFTQTTCDSIGFVVPQLVSNYSPGYSKPITEPSGTITCQDHHGLLIPFAINLYKFSDINKPIRTQQAGGVHHGIVTGKAWNTFIASYYSGSNGTFHISDQMPTVTTNDRAGFCSIEERIDDCYYRMLKPHEVQKAMAFADNYIVLGNSKEKVKQLGNAVTPPVMKWIVKKAVESLC
jgi:DNA (cytosine-5)-methyltransferase 1